MTDTPSAAEEVSTPLKRVGIDITDACQVLEDETVSKFALGATATALALRQHLRGRRRCRLAAACDKSGTPGSGYSLPDRTKENSWAFGCSPASTRATTCAELSAWGRCVCMSTGRASAGGSVRVAGRGMREADDTRSTLPVPVTGRAGGGIRAGNPTSPPLVSPAVPLRYGRPRALDRDAAPRMRRPPADHRTPPPRSCAAGIRRTHRRVGHVAVARMRRRRVRAWARRGW